MPKLERRLRASLAQKTWRPLEISSPSPGRARAVADGALADARCHRRARRAREHDAHRAGGSALVAVDDRHVARGTLGKMVTAIVDERESTDHRPAHYPRQSV